MPPIPPRGRDHREAGAQGDRADPRVPHRPPRPVVVRDEVRQGPHPAVGHRALSQGQAGVGPGGASPGVPRAARPVHRGVRDDGLRPPPGGGPSRPEAGQRDPGRLRRDDRPGLGPGDRLGRDRLDARRRLDRHVAVPAGRVADEVGQGLRYARLHGPGAGRGAPDGGRAGQRHLLPGRDPLHDPRRPDADRRSRRPDAALEDPERRLPLAPSGPRRRAGRARRRLPEGDAPQARGPLRRRPGAGPRPGAMARRRAGLRLSRADDRSPRPLVEAPSRPDRPGGVGPDRRVGARRLVGRRVRQSTGLGRRPGGPPAGQGAGGRGPRRERSGPVALGDLPGQDAVDRLAAAGTSADSRRLAEEVLRRIERGDDDHHFVKDLHEARLLATRIDRDGRFAVGIKLENYARIFREHGIDLEAIPDEAAGADPRPGPDSPGRGRRARRLGVRRAPEGPGEAVDRDRQRGRYRRGEQGDPRGDFGARQGEADRAGRAPGQDGRRADATAHRRQQPADSTEGGRQEFLEASGSRPTRATTGPS